MSNGQNFLTKIQFRENMGLLGLGTIFYLSDRIFDILDDDRDGKVKIKFLIYFFLRLDLKILLFILIRFAMATRWRKLKYRSN